MTLSFIIMLRLLTQLTVKKQTSKQRQQHPHTHDKYTKLICSVFFLLSSMFSSLFGMIFFLDWTDETSDSLFILTFLIQFKFTETIHALFHPRSPFDHHRCTIQTEWRLHLIVETHQKILSIDFQAGTRTLHILTCDPNPLFTLLNLVQTIFVNTNNG